MCHSPIIPPPPPPPALFEFSRDWKVVSECTSTTISRMNKNSSTNLSCCGRIDVRHKRRWVFTKLKKQNKQKTTTTCNRVYCMCFGPWPFNLFFPVLVLFYWVWVLWPQLSKVLKLVRWARRVHSSGAVWESRWPFWAVRPNEPSGFRGRKDLLNRASALVTTCP